MHVAYLSPEGGRLGHGRKGGLDFKGRRVRSVTQL